MPLVLKRLCNRSAHLNLYTVELFMRKCVYGDMVIVQKAPVTIDTQTEHYGKFVKTVNFDIFSQASINPFVSNKPSFERQKRHLS